MLELGKAIEIGGFQSAEFYDVKAKANGGAYRIHVASPLSIERGREYPVIYVLDGNLYFGMVMQMQRLMAMVAGEVPPAFVVSVGCAAEDLMSADMLQRHRDLTPTVGGEFEAAVSDFVGAAERGGGEAFFSFLHDELMPAMRAAYPIDATDATIMGASFGGLFPTWVLLTQPESFQRYVIVSPSLWWDGEAVWRWEAAAAASRTDISAAVFITAGAMETADMIRARHQRMRQTTYGPWRSRIDAMAAAYEKYGYSRMAELTPILAERLISRRYKSLRVHCHNMPDETHTSVPPGAFARGLRYVFRTWEPIVTREVA